MRFTGRRGWTATRQDVLDLDQTLRPILAAGLTKLLAEHRDSYPSCLGSVEEWRGILQDMIYSFSAKSPEPSDYDFEFFWVDSSGKTIHKITHSIPYEIQHTNPNEYWKFITDSKAFDEDCKRGYNLFAKHFEDLWL